MAKSEAVSESTEIVDPFTQYDGVPLSDIPDRDPLLNAGRYQFQFVGHKAELTQQDDGPVWRVTLMVDPVEYLEEDEPQEGFANLRQFVTYWPRSRRDMKDQLGSFAVAFGADPNLPIKDGNEWPALEDAKGGFATAKVVRATIKRGKRAGEEIRNLTDFHGDAV